MRGFVPHNGVLAQFEGHAIDRRPVLVGTVLKLIHQVRVARFRFLSQEAGQNGAIGTVPFACGAQAAEKPGLDRLGLIQDIPRKSLQSLPEITRNPQGCYCM